MIKILNTRLLQYDSVNLFGIKMALFTFVTIVILTTCCVIINHEGTLILSLIIGFIGIIINSITLLTVIINGLTRLKKFTEAFFTIYVMLLNIPIALLTTLFFDQ